MKPNQLLSVLSLFLLVPASITWAQTISSQKGLTTAEFNTSAGNIKVYVPDDIRPGDIISGTIKTEPTGKNAKQVEKNLADLKKYSLNLNSQTFSVDNTDKRIQFVAKDYGARGIELTLMTTTGKPAGQLTFNSNMKPAPEQCMIPTHALTSAPLRIPGPFDGDASNTSCTLNNNPVEILAESPRQCILFYPADAGGLHSLNVQESGKSACSQQVSGVDMNVSAGKLDLMKGEKTFIDVTITGLQNLPDTAVLSLINMTSGIVTMLPANTIVIPLAPDSVGSGTFTRHFDVQSMKTGRFIVNVDLDLPVIQYEVKKLDKPRHLEDEALHTGLSEAIKKLEADAGGAQGKEYSNMCENCQKCIRAMAGKWAEDLVRKLGEDLIKESVSKAIGMFMESKELLKKLKEMVDKANEAEDKADKLADELAKKIKAGELQLLVFQDQLCDSNKDCVVSAMIFYDPTTGCVTAFVKCNGRAGACCPKAFNTAKITYCTDEHGMPKDLPHVEVISE